MNEDLTRALKAEALRLGFDQVGVAPAVAPPHYPDYLRWLGDGNGAGMSYLERQAPARAHPDHLLAGVRSVVMVSLIYGRPAGTQALGPTHARVAKYAQGEDYHELFWRRLARLLEWLKAEVPGVAGRAVADTAPLLERDFGRLAGLGWVGKNTMLIDRQAGSFTLLGALLVDVELRPDEPHAASHCGTCTRCLDACPTDAFTAPYQLDARRCLSYWTIEHRGMIDEEFAGRLGDWVFGCDVCQDVCPWNRKARPAREAALLSRSEWVDPDLLEWLTRSPSAMAQSLKGTALSRTKRAGLLRNAALVLGARGEASAVPALTGCLDDADPVVRASAAWALGRIGTRAALDALTARADDPDPLVRTAIAHALSKARAAGVDAGADAAGARTPAT
jgi:epoxyqueuosine reductase